MGPVRGQASAHAAAAAGAAARRVAIWVCLVGLPLGYEASDLLAGPHAFYSGDAAYWFSGLYVRLALTLLGLALVLWAALRSGGGADDPGAAGSRGPWRALAAALAALGWPRGLRWWEAALGAAVFAGALALVFQHPATVSAQVSPVSASTPVSLLERASLLGVAVVEAPAQELIWRGALIRWLEPSIGMGGAALLSTASFVFFHPTFAVAWQGLAAAVPVAIAYAALFLWRRSIGPSAFLHFLIVAGQLTIPVAA
jgi:membrane protease YdiL (CAAX protease family)